MMPQCRDAVLVVPGIMGSELADAEGNVVWGFRPDVLAKAWLTGSVRRLLVNDEDLDGRGRLRPTRMLRVPAYLPMFGGLEPYTDLLRRVTETVVDPRAAGEFAYDWRLPVVHSAENLAARCQQHLETWREVVGAVGYADPDEVRVVIVAHSMGGLVARAAMALPGMDKLIRRVITLGTPYFGAVKAIQTLATGEGTPIPQRAAREFAITCPSLYDLLPRYRCIVDAVDPGNVRHFTPDDAAAVGADRGLARDAADRWAGLGLTGDASNFRLAPMAVVGVQQPTLQTVRIADGACQFLNTLNGVDHGGDSTVYRQSAAPVGVTAFPLPQRHGALAKSSEALAFVVDKLTGADTGPPLGTRPLGADIPDVTIAGGRTEIRITGGDGDPVGITVLSTDFETGRPITWADISRDGDDLRYAVNALRPGLHRVEVKGGGYSAVSDLMLAVDG